MNTQTRKHTINRREALKRVGVLLGGAVALPTAAGVLGGCQADPSPDWTPATLSTEQNDLVTVISEHIIPATETPGAKAAQVNRFIDKMLTEWHPPEVRARFLQGLDEVNARSQQMLGQAFLESSAEDQVRLLTALDEEAYASPSTAEEAAQEEAAEEQADDRNVEGEAVQEATRSGSNRGREEADELLDADSTDASDPGRDSTGEKPAVPPENADAPPFFRTMKEMTLLGYYTSEIGATEALQWTAIPGRYDACVPLSEVGRAWA